MPNISLIASPPNGPPIPNATRQRYAMKSSRYCRPTPQPRWVAWQEKRWAIRTCCESRASQQVRIAPVEILATVSKIRVAPGIQGSIIHFADSHYEKFRFAIARIMLQTEDASRVSVNDASATGEGYGFWPSVQSLSWHAGRITLRSFCRLLSHVPRGRRGTSNLSPGVFS